MSKTKASPSQALGHYATQEADGYNFYVPSLLIFGSKKERDAYCQHTAGALPITPAEAQKHQRIDRWTARMSEAAGCLFHSAPTLLPGRLA